MPGARIQLWQTNPTVQTIVGSPKSRHAGCEASKLPHGPIVLDTGTPPKCSRSRRNSGVRWAFQVT